MPQSTTSEPSADPQASQHAQSPDETSRIHIAPHACSRPAKRPRRPTPHITPPIHPDDGHVLSQVSPSRPSHASPRIRLVPPVPSDGELDESARWFSAEASPSPTPSSVPHPSPRVVPWRGPPPPAALAASSGACVSRVGRGVAGRDCGGRSAAEGKVGDVAVCVDGGGDGDAVQFPDECDIPSPPDSSSSDGIQVEAQEDTKVSKGPGVHADPARPYAKPPRPPPVWDSFEPPVLSQDSAYLSFSKSPHRPLVAKQEPSLDPITSLHSKPPTDDSTATASAHRGPKKYYTKAFDYVITEVLARYRRILRPSEIQVATVFQTELSANAQALFVRIYRRKQPQWYRLSALKDSYGTDIDIEEGIAELCNVGFTISSTHAGKASSRAALLLTKQLVSSLDLSELRGACGALVEGKAIKKLPKSRLLPALKEILSGGQSMGRNGKRLRQSTLSGLSPADCLSRAILRQVGHSIKIPEHILNPLKRIHFLFFLEDGHDSPNIILADTGKARFPVYVCEPNNNIFLSSNAFDDYEGAVRLEEKVNCALEDKEFSSAAYWGSIAELEVREFFDDGSDGGDGDDGVRSCQVEERKEELCEAVFGMSSIGQQRITGERSAHRRAMDRKEAEEQLKHPFCRRFTAQWVYVRACWHSVHALERLSEFDSAVDRLKLLLSTGLVPRRRGKCLNRLTINLFKHLGKLEEPLHIILSALESPTEVLHLGDRVGLANRGLQIHRKIALPRAEATASANDSLRTKASRKKAALDEVASSRPKVLVETLSRFSAKVAVRKIFGRSLNIVPKNEEPEPKEVSNPWHKFMDEDSRDSAGSTSSQRRTVMGKAVFASFRSTGGRVSVEEYAMEWYLGKQGWSGVHDEGRALRFLYCLFFWECALFANVPDVFQTPYQDRPLDLFTESFYPTRREAIDQRLAEIAEMGVEQVRKETILLYERYQDVRGVGCAWSTYDVDALSAVAAGLGGRALSHCCKLLSQDYGYWGGGLPDLTLWKVDKNDNGEVCETKLVEVKSARDILSERQRAWLIELQSEGADCEVCKVVERVTANNASDLEDAQLDSVAISTIDANYGND